MEDTKCPYCGYELTEGTVNAPQERQPQERTWIIMLKCWSFYQLTSATIKYILYWKDVEENKEHLIVLPELTFDKFEMPAESSQNAEETEIG